MSLLSRKFTLALSLLFIVPAVSWAFSKAKTPETPTAEASPAVLGPGMATLSATLRDHLSGQSLDDPSRRASLAKLADDYVEFKRLRKGSARRAKMIDDCQKEAEGEMTPQRISDGELPSDPFCVLIAEADQDRPRRSLRTVRQKVRRSELRRIQRALVNGQIGPLGGYSESVLLGAMKKLPERVSLHTAMNAALAVNGCPSTALLTALGLRAERGFPDPAEKDLAIRLFSLSIACGDDLSSISAGYRLGLIQIWDHEWAEANRVLKSVSEDPLAVDFRQRAIYWRFYAAKQMKDDKLRDEMQSRLLREYPLSLHALFTGSDPTKVESRILNQDDPVVAFREPATSTAASASAAQVNTVLMMAELLQERGEFQGATNLLDHYSDELKTAEGPVQLYTTVLLMRSGEVLRKFRWMAALFHDNPSLISPPTLQMLYPLRRFDMIRSYESVIDPYLVISLIRQESAFNDSARSVVGALGLMQLMPATARKLERRVSKRMLLDPSVNVRLGVRLFTHLLDGYDGDIELALAAYNAGKDRVDEWRKRYPTENRLLFIDLMPFRETREYVASIARNYYWYLRLYDMEAFKQRLLAPRIPAMVPVTSSGASATAPLAPSGVSGSSRSGRFSVFSQFNRVMPPANNS